MTSMVFILKASFTQPAIQAMRTSRLDSHSDSFVSKRRRAYGALNVFGDGTSSEMLALSGSATDGCTATITASIA